MYINIYKHILHTAFLVMYITELKTEKENNSKHRTPSWIQQR